MPNGFTKSFPTSSGMPSSSRPRAEPFTLRRRLTFRKISFSSRSPTPAKASCPMNLSVSSTSFGAAGTATRPASVWACTSRAASSKPTAATSMSPANRGCARRSDSRFRKRSCREPSTRLHARRPSRCRRRSPSDREPDHGLTPSRIEGPNSDRRTPSMATLTRPGSSRRCAAGSLRWCWPEAAGRLVGQQRAQQK